MAITLEEAKKNVQDDLQMGVIDEFQKSNWILEHIPFDDAVSPTGIHPIRGNQRAPHG